MKECPPAIRRFLQVYEQASNNQKTTFKASHRTCQQVTHLLEAQAEKKPETSSKDPDVKLVL
ncbi:MAG: hypothetical protein ACFFBD_26250 [Candidatus Hodarchaeota archaeon]